MLFLITHTFLNIVPAVYLGVPDADTTLAVFPGGYHKRTYLFSVIAGTNSKKPSHALFKSVMNKNSAGVHNQ